MTPQEARRLVDQHLPFTDEFPTLKLIEQRHLLAAYLIAGSHEKAAKLLDVSPRTVRTRLAGLKVRCRRSETMVHEITLTSVEPEDEMTYPSHRDFEFWDWYMNQDSVRGSGFSRPNGEQRTRNTQPRKQTQLEEEHHA